MLMSTLFSALVVQCQSYVNSSTVINRTDNCQFSIWHWTCMAHSSADLVHVCMFEGAGTEDTEALTLNLTIIITCD